MLIDPLKVNFSQRTVSDEVDKYVSDMKAGNWDWNKSGPIRVLNVNGQLVSYDNRRLMAAQQAGLKSIPLELVDPNAIMPGSKKTWQQALIVDLKIKGTCRLAELCLQMDLSRNHK